MSFTDDLTGLIKDMLQNVSLLKVKNIRSIGRKPMRFEHDSGSSITFNADGTIDIIGYTAGVGVTDHGLLTGLTDDDHMQYYNAARHTKALHDSLGLSHSSLDATSLLADDHTQYMRHDGTRLMTGDLGMNSNDITSVTNLGSTNATIGTLDVTFAMDINGSPVTDVGSISMSGDIDLNGNDIVDVDNLTVTGTSSFGGNLDINNNFLNEVQGIQSYNVGTQQMPLNVYDGSIYKTPLRLYPENAYFAYDIEVLQDVVMHTDGQVYWDTNQRIIVDSAGDLNIFSKQNTGDDIILDPDDSAFVFGDLQVYGTLSKSSGSCLTTDIFYNDSDIGISRGMVCISTGKTNGNRAFSKPITSVEPCSIANDKRVMGAKVVESQAQTVLNRKEFKLIANVIECDNTASTLGNVLENNSHTPYADMSQLELTDAEYEVMRQFSVSERDERLHIGILGQYSNVLVDADIEPIEVGDMLTTSTTIGHGMKSTELITGTMFGKSLESKSSGKGFIRVLLHNA